MRAPPLSSSPPKRDAADPPANPSSGGARPRQSPGERAAPRAVELGPLGSNVGFHIRLGSIAVERGLKRAFGEEIRLGYFPVLSLIRMNPEATQTAIAEAVGLRRSSLVPILKKLERFGWVERTGNEGDKRANLIRLTPKGHQACDEIGEEVQALEDEMRRALGDRGYEKLVELLIRLERAFEG